MVEVWICTTMALQNLQQYGCQTGNKLKEKSRDADWHKLVTDLFYDFVGILFVWVAKFKMPSNWKIIWGRYNLKGSRRTVIFLPVYKISSLKITPPKTPNSGQFSYPLPNIVSFLFRLEFRVASKQIL
jgi:hypothetical protein